MVGEGAWFHGHATTMASGDTEFRRRTGILGHPLKRDSPISGWKAAERGGTTFIELTHANDRTMRSVWSNFSLEATGAARFDFNGYGIFAAARLRPRAGSSACASVPSSTVSEHVMKTQSILAIVAFLLMMAHAIAGEIDKGVPGAPPNAQAVAGSYYCGDGLGYNVTLTLKDNGTYSGEWQGCLGKYGEASGTWTLSDKRIVLTPTNEEGNMKGHLRTLDVMKYKGGWIFARADDRDFYDKRGVSRSSCFQKRDQK
jgi:hypothetical protein